MTLTAEGIARIIYLLSGDWIVDSGSPADEAASWKNFDAVLAQMSFLELHHFALNFNWDGGIAELSRVLDHPDCDAGTALLIFWLGEPVYYFRRQAKGKLAGDHEIERYAWLKRIEERFAARGFPPSRIAVDPASLLGVPMGTAIQREYISERMFEPTAGEAVPPITMSTR